MVDLRDHKDKGILYRNTGNAVPIAYYDAAHNQYSSDRKAHHGNAIYLFGGPISVVIIPGIILSPRIGALGGVCNMGPFS